jgi:hypothetical protein
LKGSEASPVCPVKNHFEDEAESEGKYAATVKQQ